MISIRRPSKMVVDRRNVEMNCPYCCDLMEKGYIENGRGRLLWTPDGSKVPFCYPFIQGKSVLLGDNGGGPLLGSACTAFFCRKCEKIIIDLKCSCDG